MKTLSEIRKKKIAVFTFGRMNPPTIGHEKLIKKVLQVASSHSADPFVYVSFSQDAKKNPLSFQEKIKFIKLGIPEATQAINVDSSIKTPFAALFKLISDGYTDIILVVGEDKVNKFETAIRPYVNHPDESQDLKIETFQVVSAGERNPNSDGVSGMSASKMRKAAANKNFTDFKSGVLSKLNNKFVKEMFHLVRSGLKIAESIVTTDNIDENKGISMKNFKDYIDDLEEASAAKEGPPTAVDRLKDTQEREKDDLKKRQEHEKSQARESDFRKKETERKREQVQKDAEQRSKSNSS